MSRVRDIIESPLVRCCEAAFLGTVWVCTSGFTVLTDENLFRGGNGSSVRLSTDVFFQLFDLLQGKYVGRDIMVVLGAWVIVAAYVIFNSIDAMVDEGLVDSSAKTIVMIIIALDSYANWVYLSWLPWYYQYALTFVLTWVISCWGKWAVRVFMKAAANYGEGR